MNFFRVKNLEKYQHYTDRCPPWIKLHRGLLDDYDFICLSSTNKLYFILICLQASQCENKLPFDARFLQNKFHMPEEVGFKELLNRGFIEPLEDNSKMLADLNEQTDKQNSEMLSECKQNGGTEVLQRYYRDKQSMSDKKNKKHSAEDRKFAKKMITDIKKWSPSMKNPSVDSWAEHIRRMREIDEISVEDLEVTWKAVQNDKPEHHISSNGKWCGWRKVILSAGKFREKYHKVRVSLNLDKKSLSVGSGPNGKVVSI